MNEILDCDLFQVKHGQYFPVVVLVCRTRCFQHLSLWMKSLTVTIQMKATEQYFSVVLSIMLYTVFLTL